MYFTNELTNSINKLMINMNQQIQEQNIENFENCEITTTQENSSAQFAGLHSSLCGNFSLLMAINETLPRFMSMSQIMRVLGRGRMDPEEYNMEEYEEQGFTNYINHYILKLENALRQAAFRCKCKKCVDNEYENYGFWIFDLIGVMIDDSYEFHGRVIGHGEQRGQEFRLRYFSKVDKNCKQSDVVEGFALLLNEMHEKMNRKFITIYEFLRPMSSILEEMKNTVYDESKIIGNLYCLFEIIYCKDYQLYDTVCLTFFQNISIEEFIRRQRRIPSSDYSFKGMRFDDYFCEKTNINDYRVADLCFKGLAMMPEDEDNAHALDRCDYSMGNCEYIEANQIIRDYVKDRGAALQKSGFKFERMYGIDPLLLAGPSSIVNGQDTYDFEYLKELDEDLERVEEIAIDGMRINEFMEDPFVAAESEDTSESSDQLKKHLEEFDTIVIPDDMSDSSEDDSDDDLSEDPTEFIEVSEDDLDE